MVTESRPVDPRTVDELVNAALTETDAETAWKAVCALHWRGTDEVLQRAEQLCVSPCSQERRLGADILGQLGVPDRVFPVKCCRILRRMLQQGDEPDVLQAVLVALSHQNDIESIPSVVRYSIHPGAEVRHGVVLALTRHDVPPAVDCLITLSNDPDAHVRDWATFALGTQIELDTPAIRDALADRLEDPDDDTRAEALVGLARRKDGRVVDALKKELSSDYVGTLEVEAAEMIGSAELRPHLISLREWWGIDPDLLERAISAS